MSTTHDKAQIELSNTILSSKNPAWNHKAEQDSIERCLTDGAISEMVDMRTYLQRTQKIAHFAGEVYLALLNNGAKAVWKPRSNDNVNCAYAEVAAYQASR